MLDNDMKETADEINYPEAPGSVTVRGYYKGYSVLLTNRDEKVKVLPLLNKAMEAIDWMEENGFKPSWNENTNGKAKEEQPARTKVCNDCGGTRTLREGEKNGKHWAAWFCSNPECKPEWVNLVKDKRFA